MVEPLRVGEKRFDKRRRVDVVIGCDCDFYTIAGGQDHTLDHAGAALQCRERGLEIGRAECEALANRNRRGSVVQSCDPEFHLVTYVMNSPTGSREGDYRHSHRSGFSSPPARRHTQKYH